MLTLEIHRNQFEKIASPFAVMVCEITEDNLSVSEITRCSLLEAGHKVAYQQLTYTFRLFHGFLKRFHGRGRNL